MQRTYTYCIHWHGGIIGLYMTRISFIRLNIFLDLANNPKCSNKWFFNVLKWKMKTNYNFFLFYWLVKSWQIESNISLQMNKRQRYLQQWMHFRDSFYFKQLAILLGNFHAFCLWILHFHFLRKRFIILIHPGIVSHWSIISLYFVLHLISIPVVLSLYKHNVYL